MHKSAGKIVSWRWLSLVLLLASAPLALAQQPAPPAAPVTPAPAGREVNARVTQTPIDASINDDPAVDQMLAVYGPKARALDVVIGKLKGELRKGGYGAGSLGNFVADGMRAQGCIKIGKPVDLAIMNGGG